MKKVIKILILFLFLTTIQCNASTNTFNRNELDNYGVKKDWTIDEKNLNNVLNTKAVDASEKIYDYSDVLTEEEEVQLKNRIDEFIEKTKTDMVIVTDKIEYDSSLSSYCYDEDAADSKIKEVVENYAADFYDYNDFGMNFDNNSGVLLMRNTAIDPCFNAMYYDMYTFGDTQLYFTQYRYDNILDGIYNNLHNENYLDGFIDFIDRTENYILEGIPSEMDDYYVDDNGFIERYPDKYYIPWTTSAIISFIIALITIIILIKKNKMVRKATSAEEYLIKNSINITNRQDMFIHTHTSSYTTSSDSGGSSGGGGFSSHSGSSGGGHSSGGGRHG